MNEAESSNLAIQVRTAQVSDVPLIHSMIRALAEYEKLAHAFVVTEAQLREQLFGSRPAAEVLVATLNGTAAGYALFFPTFSTFVGKSGIWLEDLFVLPRFRKQGVGGRLLLEVAKLAVKRQCGRLEWSVLDWNEPALNLYRRRGATVLDDWRICRVDGQKLADLAQSGA